MSMSDSIQSEATIILNEVPTPSTPSISAVLYFTMEGRTVLAAQPGRICVMGDGSDRSRRLNFTGLAQWEEFVRGVVQADKRLHELLSLDENDLGDPPF